ncbi:MULTISPECIES: hypothetical protein [unclassified Streptomyces]|uniref:hypothetical protein n=1 Tax=unclassified Streptomyces TaxID=2593676 RepID=UPI002E18ECB5|nr:MULTISPECIES: hypothetical protein [unclassified Streptomyces]
MPMKRNVKGGLGHRLVQAGWHWAQRKGAVTARQSGGHRFGVHCSIGNWVGVA